jgi:hypothetical protein
MHSHRLPETTDCSMIFRGEETQQPQSARKQTGGRTTHFALQPGDAKSRRGKGTQSQKNGWNWFRNLKVFPDAIGTIPIGEALARKIVHPHLPTFPLFLDSLCGSLRLGDFASKKTKCVVRPNVATAPARHNTRFAS